MAYFQAIFLTEWNTIEFMRLYSGCVLFLLKNKEKKLNLCE